MGSAYSQQQVFLKFRPTGSIILVAPSFKDAGFSTFTFFTFGFSSTEPIIYSGIQPDYFTEHLPATSSFSISPTTANSDEPIAFEEHNRWCFENPGKRR